MTFCVIEKGTGKMSVIIPNVFRVDQHFNNQFDVWTHNDEKTFAKIEAININPETQWLSIDA